MSADAFDVGIRVEGPVDGPRRRIHYQTAADAYRTCDPRAVNGKEAYIGHFRFKQAMGDYLAAHGSVKGFVGDTWASRLALDIDRVTIDAALADTRALIHSLEDDYGVPPEYLLVFFSGRKGFHVEALTDFWAPAPGPMFHRIAREFAERIAARAGVTIDTGVYDPVRLLRAANSRHSVTGLYKRWLPADKLDALTADDCMTLAQKPCPFDWPSVDGSPDMLAALWDTAAATVAAQAEAAAQRRADIAAGRASAKLNDLTRRLLAGEPIEQGKRHKRVYSAAANLAELGVPLHAAHELLTEPGRDSGLPPRDVFRAIENGYGRGADAC